MVEVKNTRGVSVRSEGTTLTMIALYIKSEECFRRQKKKL